MTIDVAKVREVRRTQAERLRSVGSGWIRERLPTVLPPTWHLIDNAEDGARYRNSFLGIIVIISGAVQDDGKRWIHLSASKPERILRWDELVEVKELFLGAEVYAYKVIPPRSKYVNIHPNVLHLFHCVDVEPLPDFTGGSGSL